MSHLALVWVYRKPIKVFRVKPTDWCKHIQFKHTMVMAMVCILCDLFRMQSHWQQLTKLFILFEINNNDNHYPLCDIDPDAHYFNELNAHISQNCNYYDERSCWSVNHSRFPTIIHHKVFALFHINIRSQKANLRSFDMCLKKHAVQCFSDWCKWHVAQWLQLAYTTWVDIILLKHTDLGDLAVALGYFI